MREVMLTQIADRPRNVCGRYVCQLLSKTKYTWRAEVKLTHMGWLADVHILGSQYVLERYEPGEYIWRAINWKHMHWSGCA